MCATATRASWTDKRPYAFHVSPIVPLPLIDAALRGSVLALLLLPALVLLRRAPAPAGGIAP